MSKNKDTEKEVEKACDCQKGCDCADNEACTCGEECTCDESCACSNNDEMKNCKCAGQGEDACSCSCGETGCDCEKEVCHCDESCDCGCQEGKTCTCGANDSGKQPDEYLVLARQIQADFENFRRHALEEIDLAKIAGQASVIEVFLPCLDTFKEAKKSIHDEAILKGVEMIETKILDTLRSLGVERMETIGKVYDPHLHNVIAVMQDTKQENDIILEEYQAGYKFNGKVLRYAKVIVNKKED